MGRNIGWVISQNRGWANLYHGADPDLYHGPTYITTPTYITIPPTGNRARRLRMRATSSCDRIDDVHLVGQGGDAAMKRTNVYAGAA